MNRTTALLGALLTLTLAACGGSAAPASTSAPASPVASASTAPKPAASGEAKPAASAKPATSGEAKPAASGSAAAKPPASAASKPGAAGKMSVSYTTISTASSVPWIAKGAGLYDKQGLDVSLEFLSPATLTAGLLAGSLDAGFGSPGNIATADAQGGDLVMFGALYEGPIFSIIAKGNINGLQDLRGKKITATQRGATSDLLLRDIAKQQKWGENDLNVVYIPETSAQVAALSSGAVDAAILAEPGVSIGLAQGAHLVYDFAQNATGTGSISMSIMATKRQFLTSHRDQLKRFLMADMEAAHLMKTKPDEAAKYAAPYLKLDDLSVVGKGVASISRITHDDMSFSNEGMQSILDTTATTSPEVGKLKPSDITDQSIIDEIRKSGFLDTFK